MRKDILALGLLLAGVIGYLGQERVSVLLKDWKRLQSTEVKLRRYRAELVRLESMPDEKRKAPVPYRSFVELKKKLRLYDCSLIYKGSRRESSLLVVKASLTCKVPDFDAVKSVLTEIRKYPVVVKEYSFLSGGPARFNVQDLRIYGREK